MHSWNISAREAIAMQKQLAAQVICTGMPEKIDIIAGVDLAYDKKSELGFCSIILFSFPDLSVIESAFCHDRVTFPYIPGLLTFREGPLFLKTFETLDRRPDLILFDGQGRAHPRGLGIASHMGLVLNVPTIGCAKSKLFGEYRQPCSEKGSRSILTDKEGNRIGTVLRTRDGVKPVFVSPGHLTGVDESADIVMRCVVKYRIPEPIRAAHNSVGNYKRSILEKR